MGKKRSREQSPENAIHFFDHMHKYLYMPLANNRMYFEVGPLQSVSTPPNSTLTLGVCFILEFSSYTSFGSHFTLPYLPLCGTAHFKQPQNNLPAPPRNNLTPPSKTQIHIPADKIFASSISWICSVATKFVSF